MPQQCGRVGVEHDEAVRDLISDEACDQLYEHPDTGSAKSMAGRCRPSPLRKIMNPKPDGSQRELTNLTVLDQLIQQALLQVLQPLLIPPLANTTTTS